MKKKGLLLIIISAIGFLVYFLTGKIKKLKKRFDRLIMFKDEALIYEKQPFGGELIASVCSNCTIDFSDAILLDDNATLVIYGEFSNFNVIVPRAWEVDLIGKKEKSAVTNKLDKTIEIDGAPKLTIDYDLKCSALTVSTKE